MSRLRLPASAGAPVRWALLADPHIDGDVCREFNGHRPMDNLNRALPSVIAAQPDAVLIVGDLAAERGYAADYARLTRLLEPLAAAAPLCLTLGNHDNRKGFLQAFHKRNGHNGLPPKVLTVAEHEQVRLLVLDSLRSGEDVGGTVGPAQLEWLARQIDQMDDRPVVVCLHHAPEAHEKNLDDAPELLGIVQARRKVKAIFHGHAHEYRFTEIDGLHVIGLPALGMPLEPGQRLGWVDALFSRDAAVLRFRPLDSHEGETLRLDWR